MHPHRNYIAASQSELAVSLAVASFVCSILQTVCERYVGCPWGCLRLRLTRIQMFACKRKIWLKFHNLTIQISAMSWKHTIIKHTQNITFCGQMFSDLAKSALRTVEDYFSHSKQSRFFPLRVIKYFQLGNDWKKMTSQTPKSGRSDRP